MKKTLNIAHRGFSGQYPANTLIAYRKAVDVKADVIELDVLCSRDGEIVTIHDTNVDHTTNGTGRVGDLSLQELKTLDAGSWFSPRFKGEAIPTLRETFEALQATPVKFCIEIKGDTIEEARYVAQQTVKIIEAYNLSQRCMFASFKPEALTVVQHLLPQVPTAFVPDKASTLSARELCAQVVNMGAAILSQRYQQLTPELVTETHHHGISLWAWTVNTESDMRSMLELGIEGIITNHPEILQHLLSEPYGQQ